ncbi:hypothetical protein [Kitasatospora sp. NPDC057223]|uniref:hypothetical protein n=1 Tax=Kitasatospora sp. NPDC057223 TaxID=3346055 RepID=UPI003626BC47
MTTATFTLGQHIAAALHLRGIQATYNGHASARSAWLEVHLPGGTAIWISDQDAKIDINPSRHHGLNAIHYLGDPYGQPGHAVTVHSADRDPATTNADTAQTDIDALAAAVAAHIDTWNKSPAARHPDRPIDEYGVMDLPVRYLRPGDITVHTGTGTEAVVVNTQRLGRGGEHRRTTRTITPPTRGGTANLPATHWQFPHNLRSAGAQVVTVVAHRHHDPDTLPPIPYPQIPEHFRNGDHVVHESTIWERTDGAWLNATHTPYAKPTADDAIRRLFTDDNCLRLGIPAYQPAH